jgi:predicted nucleotidyltransferase
VARAFAQRLAKQGAGAVFVFGSRVRGDFYQESDIDIQAIGERSRGEWLERYREFLVSVSWMTVEYHNLAFRNPAEVGAIVPAWRNALIIYDPGGVASTIKDDAQRWRWESLSRESDEWVAEHITGLAEEVHRLVGSLQLGRRSIAAVVRSTLTMKMAPILAVHQRMLYGTENQLWDLVSTRMGTKWSEVQSAALGEGGQDFEDTCEAALELYVLTAREVEHLLNRKQLQVVVHACKVAGHPLQSGAHALGAPT